MNNWRIRVLWTKKLCANLYRKWLSLSSHMGDTVRVAKLLWHNWFPASTRFKIVDGLDLVVRDNADYDKVDLRCFMFLAAAHDLGKADPVFQEKFRQVPGK